MKSLEAWKLCGNNNTRFPFAWDAQKKKVVNDPEANAMLRRPYRAPWDAELRA